MLAAIVLAAGASQRMGGHPKALLMWQGEAFLTGILKACYAAGIERRVAVLGHHAGRILAAVDLAGVTVTHSAELAAGPIGSIRAGLAAVQRHPVDGILVWPVDRPHVQVRTVAALVGAFAEGTHAIVVPRFGDARGHPVIFGRAVFEELRAAPDDQGARAVVRRDAARVRVVPVDDAAVVLVVNPPDEYADLVRRSDPPA